MIEETRVLLLGTHRGDFAYARMYEEQREIEDKIQAGTFRGSFHFDSRAALRISDLDALLLKHRPHIVHFSAHATPDEGLTLEDDFGLTKPMAVNDLTRVLTALKDDIRIVFFNVCHSKPFAEAVSNEIDYAIGIDGTISDESALAFAGSFYRTLAFGRSVNDAFEVAKGLAGSEAPLLFVREGVDSSEPFLRQEGRQEGRQEKVRRLKSVVRRLIEGTASEDERLGLQREVGAGNVILDENEQEGNDDGGDDQLHVKLTPAAYQEIKERLFPAPPGIAPPFPPFVFIGREGALRDVKELLGNKEQSAGKGNVTVVRGWPGVGKTTLVGVIGRDADIARTFPQGVLWTSLEQKPNVLSEMARWGRALGTDEILRAPTLTEATAQLAALLRRRRMLLIVDDVWETAHAVPFTEVIGDQCALLITTRITSVAEDLTTDEKRLYVLPVLTEEDSLKLLRVLAPEIVEQHQDECRELVRDLECLPLALHVAGRLLKSEAKLGWGVADLIQEIREGARLIPEPAPKDRLEGETIPTVSALLTKSTDVLDDFTRDCFAYLAAFAPKPATFDLAAMKAVWEVDDPKPIVRELVGHGLLEPAGDGRFQMHRILVDHARWLCTP